jgi:Tfp pilus assembly protein PilN
MARRINLVPPSERARTTTNFGMLVFVAVAVVVVFGLGLGYYMLSNSLGDRKDQLTTVQNETQTLQVQVASLKRYGELDTERKQVEQVVQSAYASRTPVADILDKLSLVLPDNVWLNSLDLTLQDPGAAAAKQGTSSGGSSIEMSGNTYGFQDIAQLLVRLQLMQSLSDISLSSAGAPVGSVDTTKDVKGFSIQGTVVNTQPETAPLPVSQVEVEGL